MQNNFLEELDWRGMLYDKTAGIEEQLSKELTLAYIGFDATATSLHVGNLATIILLKHFQIAGHKPIILIGGATTMVGDPGGKKEERKLIDEEVIRRNQKLIAKQLSKFLNFNKKENSAEIYNNYDWFKDFNILKFLREVGKFIPVTYMISKESVKKRLETGLSFAEFSYQMLQGYDFYHLYKIKGVKVQMGGSDQWGNLTTGTELIRKKIGGEAYAITTPLITKSDGTKFGKTENGAIWLDPNMTSPYAFYQFWLNLSDDDSKKFIKIFTFLKKEEIISLIEQHDKEPHKRILQKTLAKKVTIFVHSLDDYKKVKLASESLFGKSTNLMELDKNTFLMALENIPKIEISMGLYKEKETVFEFLSKLIDKEVFASKSEVRRLLKENGLSINKIKMKESYDLEDIKLLYNKYLLLQKGKKNYFLIELN